MKIDRSPKHPNGMDRSKVTYIENGKETRGINAMQYQKAISKQKTLIHGLLMCVSKLLLILVSYVCEPFLSAKKTLLF